MPGGTFALYSLLCRHAKFSLLPNQQAADEELSAYKYGPSSQATASSPLKRFLEKHKRLRTALLLVVLFGACMVIGDGVLTPAISGQALVLLEWFLHVVMPGVTPDVEWEHTHNTLYITTCMFGVYILFLEVSFWRCWRDNK